MYKKLHISKEAKEGSIKKWRNATEVFELTTSLPLNHRYQVIHNWWQVLGYASCSICNDVTKQHPEVDPPINCRYCPLYINGVSKSCHPSWDKINYATNASKAIFLEVFGEESRNLLNEIEMLPTRD